MVVQGARALHGNVLGAFTWKRVAVAALALSALSTCLYVRQWLHCIGNGLTADWIEGDMRMRLWRDGGRVAELARDGGVVGAAGPTSWPANPRPMRTSGGAIRDVYEGLPEVTIVHSYYAQGPLVLTELVHHYTERVAGWMSSEEAGELPASLQIVIVDDGSPRNAALPAVREALQSSPPPANVDLRFDVVTLLEDVGFNNGGARNTALLAADAPFTILSDIDFAMSKMMLKFAASDDVQHELSANPHTVYQIPDGMEEMWANLYLVNTAGFSALGGYDEDFSGNYGHEDLAILESIRFKKIVPDRNRVNYELKKGEFLSSAAHEAACTSCWLGDERKREQSTKADEKKHMELNGPQAREPFARVPWVRDTLL